MDLTFSDTDSISMQSNIGGPPRPFYKERDTLSDTLLTTTNDNLTNEQKREAYINYINNNGYTLFDYTKITNNTLKSSITIVNNTSFFVFFSLFIIFFILILFLIVYDYIELIVGLYLILIFSIVIYISSVIYRKDTITAIQNSVNSINADILKNKIEYENSIIQLPNHVVSVSQTLNSSSN